MKKFVKIGFLISIISIHINCKEINLIKIEDKIINPVIADYICSAIKLSEKKKVICLIIQLDTPGGLLHTTRRIVKEMLNANVPIVVYVSPNGARAGSAGVFITLASNIAAMAPSTNIGAARPIAMGERRDDTARYLRELLEELRRQRRREKKDEKKEKKKREEVLEPAPEKILMDTIAWAKGIAEARNRNVKWAVKSITENSSITEKEALKINVINLIANDINELLSKLNGMTVTLPSGKIKLDTKNAKINKIDLSPIQKFLNTIINPNIAYILLILGFYGLLAEFTSPGFGFPGIAGTISLLLALYAFHILPINYVGLALIILAMILFIVEVITPGFGGFGIGGVISLILGSIMLVNPVHPFTRISLELILSVAAAQLIIILFLTSLVISQKKRKLTGTDGLIGKIATVYKTLSPTGKVLINGEIWDAYSKEIINENEEVEIVKVEGLKLFVKKR